MDYVRVDGKAVAYQVSGQGTLDILLFPGEYMPVDSYEEEPRLARSLRRLASLGRVILFNRRGVGLSDLADGPLTQDHYVEDALAVADAVGANQPVIMGWNVGGPAAMLFAARHPERTTALVLINTSARLARADDYPIGFAIQALTSTAERTVSTDRTQEFDFLSAFAPSVAKDERFRTWWDRAGNRGLSPARSAEMWDLILRTDVRDALPNINVPTLVISRSDYGGAEQRRYLADNIPGSRFVELPGADMIWWVGDSGAILDEIETFLASAGAQSHRQRRLATLMLVDVVGSTERAVALGDTRWRELLATFHELIEREVGRGGGRSIGTTGDGLIATFDMPADAVICAQRIAGSVRALDIDIRAGVHTGEIEILDNDVAGIGVHIAARVMAAAGPGEVLVSRTVCDLVIGSGLRFTDHGEHDLKGVPGRWQLFAVGS